MSDAFSVAARYNFAVTGLPQLTRTLEVLKGISAASEAISKALGTVGRVAADAGDVGVTSFTRMRDSIASATVATDRQTAALRRMQAVAAGGGGGGGGGALGAGAAGAAGGALSRAMGFGAAALGAGSIVTLYEGLKGSGSLQDSSILTGLALGKSTDWVTKNLQPLALRISQSTAQSVTDSMNILKVAAISGINDPKQLMALAPTIAKFADTQFLTRAIPFTESTAQLAKLSHILNLRTTADLEPFANTAFKASEMMPDDLATAAQQLKYFGAKYVQAGMSASTVMQIQTIADRLGYGQGRSGTGLRAILDNSLNPSKTQRLLQGQLGLNDASGNNRFIDAKTGAFSFFGLVDALHSQYDAARANGTVRQFEQSVGKAYGVQAGTILGAFSQDAGLAQRKAVLDGMKNLENLQVAQVRIMGDLNHQLQLLATNAKSLATIVSGPLVAPLTFVVGKLADLSAWLTNFFSQHPTANKFAAGGLVGLATIFGGAAVEFLTGFALKISVLRVPLQALGNALGAIAPRAIFARIGLVGLVEWIARLGSKFIPIVGWVSLAVTAIQEFVTHGTDISYAVGRMSVWLQKQGWPMIAHAFTGALGAAAKAIQNAGPQFGELVKEVLLAGLTGGAIVGPQLKAAETRVDAWVAAQQKANDAAMHAGQNEELYLENLRNSRGRRQKTRAVVVNNHFYLKGKAAEDLVRRHLPARGATASQGGHPVSPNYPSVQTGGGGFG